MGRFDGKTAIVTGGSAGIGLAVAARLASEGADVLITGRRPGQLEAAVVDLTAQGARVHALAGDVSAPDAPARIVEAALSRWSRIDVLVNNAGIGNEAAFLEIDPEVWNYDLQVMLTAPFRISQRVGREMVSTGGGAIVNLASIDGHGADGAASYGVAKAGLIQLTRNIAVELAPHGIRCNSVSPGYVVTPMVTATTTPELLAQMRTSFDRVPLGRTLTVEEVAAACAFLASDEASGITGIDLVVDGGTLADLHIIPSLLGPGARSWPGSAP
jgi:NAD(P)-dependent dehydrogenase (short-subunit alcohol dehydrogenase family)